MLLTSVFVIPLATAFLTLILSHQARWQTALSLFGGLCFLIFSLMLLYQVDSGSEVIRLSFGNWEAPFGIEFAADRLSASMVVITALMGLATLIYQLSSADPAPTGTTWHALIHGLLAGVSAAFVTADLFNLYVWFEVMLICSLGLLAYGAGLRHAEATLKYFVLNVIGTLTFLAAVALIYAQTGHLNYGALSIASQHTSPASFTPVVALLLVAFLIKAGAFPLFAWLPASYHTLPAPVLALFAGLLTKVGAYAVLRMLSDVFTNLPEVFYQMLGWLAVMTMLVGVLGAAYHWDIRRILAFHIISQIGYILLAVALGTSAGYAASIFYILHHIIVKANLFLIAGVIYKTAGSYDLRKIGAIPGARPLLALLFLVPALSLVGIPPLSGFWAKVLVIREAFSLQYYAWAGIALVVGALTLYSMMKIGMETFWKPHPTRSEPEHAITMVRPALDLLPAYAVIIGLATLTLWIGLWPETLIQFSQRAIEQLVQTP